MVLGEVSLNLINFFLCDHDGTTVLIELQTSLICTVLCLQAFDLLHIALIRRLRSDLLELSLELLDLFFLLVKDPLLFGDLLVELSQV